VFEVITKTIRIKVFVRTFVQVVGIMSDKFCKQTPQRLIKSIRKPRRSHKAKNVPLKKPRVLKGSPAN
jgi:hypothetical protein